MMGNIKILTVLLGLLALISVAYTVPTKEQKDDNEEVKSLMEDLLKGVVAQMQEDDDQQSSIKLQSTIRDLLAEVQDDDSEGDNDLSALLQSEEDEDDEQEDDDGDVILALLQDDEEESDDGAVTQEDNNEGNIQRSFSKVFHRIRGFPGRVRGICNRVSRYLKCIPGMQAEMQRADDGDEELANSLLKRIANVQENDADAQFFRRVIRRVRNFWPRSRGNKKFLKKIGRIYRGYNRCVRHYG